MKKKEFFLINKNVPNSSEEVKSLGEIEKQNEDKKDRLGGH